MRLVRPTLALVALAGLAGGCNKKEKQDAPAISPQDLAGLAAVPATVDVVIAADPRRLAGSEIAVRGVELLIERNPELGKRLERLAAGCGIDLGQQLDSVHLAMRADAPTPLLVVTGKLVEADLAACVQSTVGAGGGSMQVSQVEGRTMYQVDEGGRTVHFAFGRKDTVVLSADRDLVIAALGNGEKALDAPALKALIDRADTAAPLWAVGRVDPERGQRLLRLTRGKVTKPPTAFLASLDPVGGLDASLTAVMGSEGDAKELESQMEPILTLLSMAAQARGLGPLVARVTTTQKGDSVVLGVALADEEVKDLLSTVDSRPPAAEDAGPVPAVPPAVVDAGASGD